MSRSGADRTGRAPEGCWEGLGGFGEARRLRGGAGARGAGAGEVRNGRGREKGGTPGLLLPRRGRARWTNGGIVPALWQPGVPVAVVDSPNVAGRPDRVRGRGVLADSHLASPTMINHCSDHLLSACSYSTKLVRPGQMNIRSRIFRLTSPSLSRPDGFRTGSAGAARQSSRLPRRGPGEETNSATPQCS